MKLQSIFPSKGVRNDAIVEEEMRGYGRELLPRTAPALDASTTDTIKMMSVEEVIS